MYSGKYVLKKRTRSAPKKKVFSKLLSIRASVVILTRTSWTKTVIAGAVCGVVFLVVGILINTGEFT
ncbi:hypothetical protein [Flavobacterium sp. RSP15]|uniref:hypothetical protein n=1 Tax=Flavobacterium sp. RSP15 TaxID=2497485 RepID=UPI000F822263|nr:hypothetical protein [Flavobacterium sp. RSP15]RTY87646.1 hypothetical protein EKM00_04970 [Flavobacterium sp. RSP15]